MAVIDPVHETLPLSIVNISDIVSVLSKLPSTIISNLNTRNEINNTLLEIAKILNRLDKIPNLQDVCNAPLLRVTKVLQTKQVNDQQ